MDIITAYATKNDCYKAAQKCTPAGIVVHSTAVNNPNLKRYVDAPAEVGVNQYGNHWNNPSSVIGRKVCVHSFIGYDINRKVRVANILPYDLSCWGVGSGPKGSYNTNPAYIQFEMCEDDCKNRAYFEAVRDTAIEYCVYLCRRFNIPVENIVSHKEAHAKGYGSNHSDPSNWWDNFGYTMDMFRAAIKAKLNSNSAEPSGTPAAKTLYRVQTGAFKNKANADTLAAALKSKGFDTFVVNIGGLYKVQVGAFSVKANAEAMSAKLAAAGYKNFVTTNGAATAPSQTKIGKNDIVRVKQGAKTYTGGNLAGFVYNRDHTVSEINGDRAVIKYGGTVVAAVKVSDLILIKKG